MNEKCWLPKTSFNGNKRDWKRRAGIHDGGDEIGRSTSGHACKLIGLEFIKLF